MMRYAGGMALRRGGIVRCKHLAGNHHPIPPLSQSIDDLPVFRLQSLCAWQLFCTATRLRDAVLGEYVDRHDLPVGSLGLKEARLSACCHSGSIPKSPHTLLAWYPRIPGNRLKAMTGCDQLAPHRASGTRPFRPSCRVSRLHVPRPLSISGRAPRGHASVGLLRRPERLDECRMEL